MKTKRRKPRQAVLLKGDPWLFVDAFSQVYTENQEQKGRVKGLEKLRFSRKRSSCEVPKKDVVADIAATPKGTRAFWGRRVWRR